MASCSLKKTGQVSNKLDENSIEFVFLLGKNLPCDSILWGASIDFVNDSLLIIEELSGTSTYGVYRVYSDKLVKEGSFLTIGNGPFEAVQPYLWGNGDKNILYVTDFSGRLRCIYKMNVEKIYHKDLWETIHAPDAGEHLLFPSVAMMNDTLCFIVGSGLYRPDPTIKQRVSFIIATEGNSKCSPASGACIVSHKSL